MLLGALSERSRSRHEAILGPTWALLTGSWAHLGTKLGPSWTKLDPNWAKWSQDHFQRDVLANPEGDQFGIDVGVHFGSIFSCLLDSPTPWFVDSRRRENKKSYLNTLNVNKHCFFVDFGCQHDSQNPVKMEPSWTQAGPS